VNVYQYDSAAMFRFTVQGDLQGTCVDELEHAWIAATSVLKGKELVVDISGVTSVDRTGADLLSYMRESGVRLTAPPPLASPEIARSLGIPVAVVPPTDRRRVQVVVSVPQLAELLDRE
jgi:hypothetical protein